ncbi:MAG: hypothetical protein R3C53_22955 [Pirellulaceae bacterium]
MSRRFAAQSKLDQWAFLLLRAQDYTADELRRLLLGLEFETAINTIQIISEKTEDKQMYDQAREPNVTTSGHCPVRVRKDVKKAS